MSIRPCSKKYDISKHRYYELVHMCLQYEEWQQRLKELTPMGRSGEPSNGSSTGSTTENLAIKRYELETKCHKIQRAAKEAGIIKFKNGCQEDISEYILLAVTEEGFSYNKYMYDINCSKEYFYNCRRKFFYLLDKMM